jgi:hypothetical protein
MDNSQLDDIEEARSRFLNQDFETKEFGVDAERLAKYAKACGETMAKYTNPNAPDFQATPTWSSCLSPNRLLPEGFPMFHGFSLDGGKDVQPLTPIRPGDTLTGRSHVHDIYTKTGRSGRMIFIVSRMELTNQNDVKVALADTRVVIRENAAKKDDAK